VCVCVCVCVCGRGGGGGGGVVFCCVWGGGVVLVGRVCCRCVRVCVSLSVSVCWCVQVRELYQGVVCKVQGLQLGCVDVSAPGGGDGGRAEPCERVRRELEREVARRQALAERLCQLLQCQLQTLHQKPRAQRHPHRQLRRATR